MKLRAYVGIALGLAALALVVGSERAAAASINVNTAADELNSDGDCSLREGVRAANLNVAVDACAAGGVGLDTINVPAGTYTLTVTGQNENAAATGDLDIASNFVTVNGAGSGTTIIDGGGIDRVLDVIFNSNQVTVSNLRLQNGATAPATPGNGGGITIGTGATVMLNSVVVDGNSTPLSGGGINVSGTLTVSNSTISGNTATSAGGGIEVATSTGSLTLNDSTISGNYAVGTGGGGLDNRNVANLTNVTLSGNTATAGTSAGGGILHGNATNAALSLLNVTITGNYAGSGGGGGLKHTATGNNPTLTNVLIASNTGGNCSGTLAPSGANLDSAATCGFSISNANPNLGVLASNGGPTQTHALPSGSPAVNTGTNAGCPPADQRGVTRPQAGTCDIGAYEYDGVAPTATPTPTASPTPSPTPTPTPTPTSTPTPSPSPTPTPTPSPTSTSTSTLTPTPAPTSTPSPTATTTPTPSAAPTSSATPTPTPTPALTSTPTPSPTATATPAPTPTPTPTPTPAPTPTPTSTLPGFAFGDVDCSGQVNSIDALKVLRFSSGLGYSQNEPCKKIGIETLANGKIQGDVDCSNSVNSIDSLKLLRYASALSYAQTEPCPDIGT